MNRNTRSSQILTLAFAFQLVVGAHDTAAQQGKSGRPGGRDNHLSLNIGNVNWQGDNGSNYSSFDAVTYRHTVTFEVAQRGTDDSEFFVTFSKESNGDSPRQMKGPARTSLAYQIYDNARLAYVLKDLPGANINEVVYSTFEPTRNRKTLDFVVVIPAGQEAAPGHYHDQVRVTLFEGNLDQYQQRAERTINIFARVEETADLAILEIGEAFDSRAVSKSIDFDELEEGESQTCDLRVRSNTRYTVSLSSQNKGYLFNTAPEDKSRVEYFVTVAGQSISLKGKSDTDVGGGSNPTTAYGDSFPMKITIGELGTASFGTYEDELTITLTTK